MLVDASCEEVCDFKLAVEYAHDFKGLRTLSHDPVLVLEPSGASALNAEFRFHNVITQPRQCCVLPGCNTPFPASQKNGWRFTWSNRAGTNVDVAGLCKIHYMRLQRLRQKKQTKELLNMTEQLPADASHEQIETLELRVSAKAAGSREDIKFERRVGDVIWSTVTPSTGICPKVCICADEHLPTRTAKNHATFRHSMLEHMLQVQRILSNMVLFKCNRCKSRFPTFHPSISPGSRWTPQNIAASRSPLGIRSHLRQIEPWLLFTQECVRCVLKTFREWKRKKVI